jgi:hypothetical protein
MDLFYNINVTYTLHFFTIYHNISDNGLKKLQFKSISRQRVLDVLSTANIAFLAWSQIYLLVLMNFALKLNFK